MAGINPFPRNSQSSCAGPGALLELAFAAGPARAVSSSARYLRTLQPTSSFALFQVNLVEGRVATKASGRLTKDARSLMLTVCCYVREQPLPDTTRLKE